jgi:hypothetical protein
VVLAYRRRYIQSILLLSCQQGNSAIQCTMASTAQLHLIVTRRTVTNHQPDLG